MSVTLDKEGEEMAQQRKPACSNRLVIRRLIIERNIWGNHLTGATVGSYNRKCGWHMNRATLNKDNNFGHHSSQVNLFFFVVVIFQQIDA